MVLKKGHSVQNLMKMKKVKKSIHHLQLTTIIKQK